MSVRDAKLCDINVGWSEQPKLCGSMAVGTCALCKNDICLRHAAHKDGMLVLTLSSRAQDKMENDIPYAADNGSSPEKPVHASLYCCRNCRGRLDDRKLHASLVAVGDDLMMLLAAVLAEKAL